ncbi:hypothetical protein ACFXHA_32780 [Nocardia sp. NPDC059240]|uniref:hypothetical protein n=1 Tax=Nocardia sp. NPDC059240 TaxID=3346786 RepID=UPI0036CE8683
MTEPTGPSRRDGDPLPIVLGGIEMRRGPRGLVWRSETAAAVAEIQVPVGPGVSVTVDAADPATVLAFDLDPTVDPAPLAAACTEDVSALVEAVRSATRTPATQPLRLRPHWARHALVVAVSQRFPEPIHEGALLLDTAAADQGVGDTASASAMVSWVIPVLSELASDCLNDRLTGAAAATLTEVARRCAEAVAGLDRGPEVAEIAELLAARQAVVDDGLLREILEYLARAGDSGLAYNLGDSPDDTGTAVEDEAEVDLLAVPPRILRWNGAREPEIRVERVSPDSVDMRVRLASEVDPRCREVGTLRAYAADGRDGSLLATAVVRPDGRSLLGHLRFGGKRGLEPVYGLFSADLGPGVIRADPTGQALRAIDRLMIGAWSAHRMAICTAAGVDPRSAADLREQFALSAQGMVVRARSLASAAADRLDALAGHIAVEDPGLGDRLVARRAAVESYLAVLDGPALHVAPGAEPLLAEQIPADHQEGEPG